jgi:hypothetical protein
MVGWAPWSTVLSLRVNGSFLVDCATIIAYLRKPARAAVECRCCGASAWLRSWRPPVQQRDDRLRAAPRSISDRPCETDGVPRLRSNRVGFDEAEPWREAVESRGSPVCRPATGLIERTTRTRVIAADHGRLPAASKNPQTVVRARNRLHRPRTGAS